MQAGKEHILVPRDIPLGRLGSGRGKDPPSERQSDEGHLLLNALSHTWITISSSYEGRLDGFWAGWTISAPVIPSVYCVETGMV
jgi:hypothetical protein